MRGENRSTQRKTSRSRVENQQTQPTDAEYGNRTRVTLVEGERSRHCPNPAPQTRQITYSEKPNNTVITEIGRSWFKDHRGFPKERGKYWQVSKNKAQFEDGSNYGGKSSFMYLSVNENLK